MALAPLIRIWAIRQLNYIDFCEYGLVYSFPPSMQCKVVCTHKIHREAMQSFPVLCDVRLLYCFLKFGYSCAQVISVSERSILLSIQYIEFNCTYISSSSFLSSFSSCPSLPYLDNPSIVLWCTGCNSLVDPDKHPNLNYYHTITSMHSSRMRTARLLTVWGKGLHPLGSASKRSVSGGGGILHPGRSAWGSASGGLVGQTPSPCGQND